MFRDLDRTIKEKHNNFYQTFSNHKGNVYFKLNHLDFVLYRCEESFNCHEKYMQEAKKRLFPYKESADPKKIREESNWAERGEIIRRALVTDIETCIIFINIILDNLIWMVGPFIKDNFTKNIPKTQSFGSFCDWIYKNQGDFTDKQFLIFMLDFRDWFEKNIRVPRNKFIVHKYGTYTQDSFSIKRIIRVKRPAYAKRSDTPTDYYVFDAPFKMDKKLREYLHNFEKIFVEKLS
jgi:hypothetical protein